MEIVPKFKESPIFKGNRGRAAQLKSIIKSKERVRIVGGIENMSSDVRG